MTERLLKIEFYVPASHLESVKLAMFDAGAGRVGDYDSCAWQTLGQGQYRPLKGSQPFIGAQDKTETIAEYKANTAAKLKFLCFLNKDFEVTALLCSH